MKRDGTYPVKLRVFFDGRQELYKTAIFCTEEQFEKAYQSKKVRSEFKDLNISLNSLKIQAETVAGRLEPFNLKKFESVMFSEVVEVSNTVQAAYNRYISELYRSNQIGNAESYERSFKSIAEYALSIGLKAERLMFQNIDKSFLQSYESYMTEKKKSLTTVGIYLRSLRSLFNMAIEAKEIDIDSYPFGRRKYRIPGSSKVNKALSDDDLNRLFYCEAQNPFQEKARDLFFLLFSCNGMNPADLLRLKNKDVSQGMIRFVRTKTKNSNRELPKQINVVVTEEANTIIEKYRSKEGSEEGYVFDIIKPGMTEQEIRRNVQNTTRFINQHLKRLAKCCGVSTKVSVQFARHTFTTKLVQGGVTIAQLSEALGHKKITTTQNYIGSFNDESRIQMVSTLFNFKKATVLD